LKGRRSDHSVRAGCVRFPLSYIGLVRRLREQDYAKQTATVTDISFKGEVVLC